MAGRLQKASRSAPCWLRCKNTARARWSGCEVNGSSRCAHPIASSSPATPPVFAPPTGAPHDGRVVAAVEPKGVLAIPGFPRRLDPGALAQFLTFSFVPGERTSLADVHEIPAGHRLEIDLTDGATRLVRWFRHEDIEPEHAPPSSWVASATDGDRRGHHVTSSFPGAGGRIPFGGPRFVDRRADRRSCSP